MKLTRRAALGAVAATGLVQRARVQQPIIRIGVPTDLSGPYSSQGTGRRTGQGVREEAVAMMKKIPTDDDCFGKGLIRADGRKIHPAYLFEVKKPEDVHGFGDVYDLAYTTTADQAFRPVAEGGCPPVKS